ncbi:MAG: hypothetical protein ACRDRI_18070 [Pseudonocardiaceae bacterium]
MTDLATNPGLFHARVASNTRTDDDIACTLLAIREADGTWMIHTLDKVAVRLTEDDAIRMVSAILHLAGHAHPRGLWPVVTTPSRQVW